MLEKHQVLLHLARRGAYGGTLNISTVSLARDLSAPQQTVSRKLVEMEQSGLISRRPHTKGIEVTLTRKGQELLQQTFTGLQAIFRAAQKVLRGTLVTGLGEGAYYVSQRKYVRQFERKLGIRPFPGTLNLRAMRQEYLAFASSLEHIRIEGFLTPHRSFGGLTAVRVTVQGIPSAVLIPDRTHHPPDIIEIISPVNLRREFSFKDGQVVEVRA